MDLLKISKRLSVKDMNILGKYGIPNLSDLSKISHKNEILSQCWVRLIYHINVAFEDK